MTPLKRLQSETMKKSGFQKPARRWTFKGPDSSGRSELETTVLIADGYPTVDPGGCVRVKVIVSMLRFVFLDFMLRQYAT